MAREEPVHNVRFPSNGGEAHGYLALPPSGRGPGLIVIQEWWGLTSHMADMTDHFAAEGFVALAPDLYGGVTTHDAEEAGRLMQALPADRAARDLNGAVDFLLGHEAVTVDGVGAAGFCMGGGLVLSLASRDPRVVAALVFYGLPDGSPDYSRLSAAVQAHFGEQDAFIPADAARKMAEEVAAATGTEPEIHFYPAGHAFLNDENLLGTYDPEQRRIAWDRATAFLHAALG